MSESRLSRWARRKAETQTQEPVEQPIEPELTEEEQELAVNETLSEAEVVEKYDLPDPDNIAMGDDITGFMKKEIPEMLRRKALRSLWKSNPVLAVLDGLNDYDEDFTNAATAMKGYQTIYKVGEGMVDRSKKAIEDAKEVVEKIETATKVEEPVQAAEPELIENPTAPEVQSDLPAPEPEADSEPQAPRFRPRMRFNP